jgi:uncharacterized protein
MPLSSYHIIHPDPWDHHRVLLFSTRKASLARISQRTLEAIRNGEVSPRTDAVLRRLKLVVPDRQRERDRMRSPLADSKALNTELYLMVVITLDCNFDCAYCYEGSQKGGRVMSGETVSHLMGFVEKRLSPGIQRLRVDFYGGEPLLSVHRIVDISERLRSMTAAYGVSYSFSLVTNGFGLTRNRVERLVPLGLRSAKVTLDGPAHLHDRMRPLRSGGPTFSHILDNIKAVWDLVRIDIGGNYGRDHFPEFSVLLDDLIAEGVTADKIGYVRFDPITKAPEDVESRYRDGVGSLTEPWLSRACLWLRERILRRGFDTPKPRPVGCMIESPAAHVIDHDGSVYKCPGFIGRPAFRIGSLTDARLGDCSAYHPGLWKNDTCLRCPYLPLCLGGCRFMSYLETGRTDRIVCRKRFFNETLGPILGQDRTLRGRAD